VTTESRLRWHFFGPASYWFELVASAGLVWVDVVLAEDFPRVFVGDGVLVGVGVDGDGCSSMLSSDSEVMHFAGSAE